MGRRRVEIEAFSTSCTDLLGWIIALDGVATEFPKEAGVEICYQGGLHQGVQSASGDVDSTRRTSTKGGVPLTFDVGEALQMRWKSAVLSIWESVTRDFVPNRTV